jgi:imidazoleglycerol-phosphate dehydratase
MSPRTAQIQRSTKETDISLSLALEGRGDVSVTTGYGFADHMLTLFGFWAGFDLKVTCSGDHHIDAHHSIEDVGLCLGEALKEALGDKKGIGRVGFSRVPMDEALAEVMIDVSGRPYLVYEDDILPPVIAGEEIDLWREFFKSVAFKAGMNLHIRYLYGKNGHHLLESAFKGFGRALKESTALTQSGVLSTKGSLD